MISIDVVLTGAISTTTCIQNQWLTQLLKALEKLLWKLDHTFTQMICLIDWSVTLHHDPWESCLNLDLPLLNGSKDTWICSVFHLCPCQHVCKSKAVQGS